MRDVDHLRLVIMATPTIFIDDFHFHLIPVSKQMIYRLYAAITPFLIWWRHMLEWWVFRSETHDRIGFSGKRRRDAMPPSMTIFSAFSADAMPSRRARALFTIRHITPDRLSFSCLLLPFSAFTPSRLLLLSTPIRHLSPSISTISRLSPFSFHAMIPCHPDDVFQTLMMLICCAAHKHDERGTPKYWYAPRKMFSCHFLRKNKMILLFHLRADAIYHYHYYVDTQH